MNIEHKYIGNTYVSRCLLEKVHVLKTADVACGKAIAVWSIMSTVNL
jgi:hypothetical protein